MATQYIDSTDRHHHGAFDWTIRSQRQQAMGALKAAHGVCIARFWGHPQCAEYRRDNSGVIRLVVMSDAGRLLSSRVVGRA